MSILTVSGAGMVGVTLYTQLWNIDRLVGATMTIKYNDVKLQNMFILLPTGDWSGVWK